MTMGNIKAVSGTCETNQPADSLETMHVQVTEALARAAGLLVDQAPLETFVAQNTLQVFESSQFHDAVRTAHDLHGADGYLSESEFQGLFHSGEITSADLVEARGRLAWPENRDPLLPGITVQDLENALLFREEPRIAPASRAWWLGHQHPAGAKAVDLWNEVVRLPWESRTSKAPIPVNTPGDLARHLAGFTLITSTRSLLVGYCSRYLDRGMAGHHEPETARFWPYFLELVAQTGFVAPYGPSLRSDALRRLEIRQSPIDAIVDLLGLCENQTVDIDEMLRAVVLRHPGWAGMFHRLEQNPEERPRADTPVHLTDFIAAQLLVEFHLAREAALQHQIITGMEITPACLVKTLREKVKAPEDSPALRRDPWNLCLALLKLNIRTGELSALTQGRREAVVEVASNFGMWRRLALWQEALEANLRNQVLKALSENPPVAPQHDRPLLDVMTCLDDREESFRRALEHLDGRIRTWGAPGFYQLPVAYRDLSSPYPRILCPLGVSPAYTVREKPASERKAATIQRTASFSRVAQKAELSLRSKWMGALIGALTAVAAFPLMVLGLFFPRWREYFQRITQAGHDSAGLDLPESVDGAGVLAFPPHEQVNRVGGLLRTIGLTDQFAPLVVVLGHGSRTANNPHKSAYDCGACRGHEGHNNARLFATLANRPEVRKALAEQGIRIPEDTWFIGGRHDTCAGTVDLLDVDLVPASQKEKLTQAVSFLKGASQLDAVERCRRFRSAPRKPNGRSAFRHVRERSVDPAQPRPELGHMTNAMVIVGRRSRTRGLFLDRRAFLVSYDPTQDKEGTVLANILRAITPIVVGINLQYYFSRVDPLRYGSGSKLPHNPVGLVGVMEGSCGDLRTGLPRQMVELHTPVRLLYVVEAPMDRVQAALAANPDLSRKLTNQWCAMAVIDPASTRQWLIEPDLSATEVDLSGKPETPRTPDAESWFSCRSGNLPLACIDPSLAIKGAAAR